MDPLENRRRREVLGFVSGRLLDVGCGYNNLTAEYGSGVGVDVHPWEGIDALVEDASRLPFASGTFDTVTAVAMLNHVSKREEALREMRRVLRPGGRLVLTMIGPFIGTFAHLVFRRDRRRRVGDGERPGLRRRETLRLLEDGGFHLEREVAFQLGLNRVFVATPVQPAAHERLRRLSIVIPVYNEVKTVSTVVERLAGLEPGVVTELIAIDDGSSDGTGPLLTSLAVRYPRLLRVETLERHSGKGAAVRRGLAMATGDVILVHDADLELDPADVPKVVEPFRRGGVTAVYGSRFLGGGRRRSLNYWGNRGLTALTNLLYGSRLTDMETGCKAFRREAVLGLDLRAAGFEIEPELTASLLRSGHVIQEVAVRYQPRTTAQGKKIRWRDGLMATYTLVRCRFAPALSATHEARRAAPT